MPPAPHLVAVAERPVVHFALAGRRAVEVGGHRPRAAELVHVPGGRDLATLPHAAGAEHRRGAGEVVDGEVVAGCPVFDAPDRAHPAVADAERVEQPGPQVGRERLARDGGDDRRQRVRGGRVVSEERARLVCGQNAHELARVFADGVDLGGIVPRVHRQQVPHGEGRRSGRRGHVEQARDRGIQRQPPLVGEKADRERREGLGCRVDERRPVEGVGRPGGLEHDLAAARDEQRVRVEALVVQSFGEGDEGGGGDADLFGRATGERRPKRRCHGVHPTSEGDAWAQPTSPSTASRASTKRRASRSVSTSGGLTLSTFCRSEAACTMKPRPSSRSQTRAASSRAGSSVT